MTYDQSPLPLFFFDNTTVDIHLRIYQDGDGYKAEIRISGVKPQRFRIGLSPNDVEELNSELQQAIDDVSKSWGKIEASNEVLLRLASAGKSAFNRIFADGIGRQTLQKAMEILRERKGTTIEISSENFILPWELLYPGSLSEPINAYNFWGMKYIIARTLIQDSRPSDMVSPIMQSSCPEVGMIADKELMHVAENEIPALQELDQLNQIHLSLLRPLDPDQVNKELEYFGDFLDRQLEIVHLACHACVSKPLGHSFLRVSDHFDITMQDFHAHEFSTSHNPLVILNACHTGTLSPLHNIFNWAALFWENGARGVLATEFPVPDWFAAVFIVEMYKHLLAGTPIGESLWATRNHFWQVKGNPLGLAYALYSPLGIRIQNSKFDEGKTGGEATLAKETI